jgi:hypothetical protein
VKRVGCCIIHPEGRIETFTTTAHAKRAMRPVHLLVVRGEHGFTACNPIIRITGYLRTRITRDPAEVTCPACTGARS